MNKNKATVYTTAKHADVSIATVTVSRIVASGLKVAPETRQRLMQVIEELSFSPRAVGTGLVVQQSCGFPPHPNQIPEHTWER